jgi:trans-aconitate 2-methyltransferase
MADWDPDLYNRFRGYRAEPVDHILARLEFREDDRIVDLGCGSGDNTVELARRSARGRAFGIDSSPAMIDSAIKLRAELAPDLAERLSFQLADISRLPSGANYTIIFSNAALQWLRGHREIFASYLEALAPRGQMVVQMPANGFETAKVEMDALAGEHPWRELMTQVEMPFRKDAEPEHYAEMLAEVGFTEIDCYYHTFHHPMDRPADVVQWYRATGLRPYLDALPTHRRDEFLAAYASRLERAYGTSGAITFTFRRLFIWARSPAA